MYTFLVILIVLIAILLVLLVLVQNSKGGGLTPDFANQNQIMGVRKTTDFLEKSTWVLITVIVVFSIAASGFYKHSHRAAVSATSELQEEAQQMAGSIQQNAAANTVNMEDAAE